MNCKDCKFGKWNHHLSETQEIEYLLAKCLIVEHEPSRKEKLEILKGIAKSFCRLSLINYGSCDKWERKWWKFWVKT